MKIIKGKISAKRLKFAIVQSEFNDFITSKLLDGAVKCLLNYGVSEKNITVIKVPGAFEIPIAADMAASSKKFNAIICVGAVIRGDTPHFEYISAETSRGIGEAALRNKIPIIFGVLTTDNLNHALERAGDRHNNKGWEAALAAIEMADLRKIFAGSKKKK